MAFATKQQEREYAKAYRAKHIEKSRAYMREYSRKPHVARRLSASNKAGQLRRNYGVSVVWYLAQYAHQDGKCAVCRAPMDKPQVDHSHETGKVRELLCVPCNLLTQNYQKLQAAVAYVERHSG